MHLPDITGWPDSQVEEMLGDLQQWEPVVRQIAKQHGLTYTSIETGFPASSAVFLLDSVALKMFTPSRSTDAAVEGLILRYLASTSVPAPRLLAEGQFTDTLCWPYLIMARAPGVALRELLPRMDDEELSAIACNLGGVVRTLHTCGPGLAARMMKFGRVQSHEPTPVLANLDLTEDHLYVSSGDEGWQIRGLIDFADSVVGPKELDWHDLRVCMFQGRPEPMATFLDSYHMASVR